MEKIYTIPVNEAFEKSAEDGACGCAFCTLYNKLEFNEIDAVLGAAMMEPDIRMETNKKGFCKEHFDIMFGYKNRLGLALILESHLGENHADAFPHGLSSLLGKDGNKNGNDVIFIGVDAQNIFGISSFFIVQMI